MTPRYRLWTVICFLSFIAAGICTAMIGATYESLTTRYAMELSNAGIFSMLIGIGSTASVLVAGRMLDRIDARYILCGGPLGIGCGALLLGLAPVRELALAGSVLFGLGFGLLLVGPNFVIASIYEERSSSAINALNFFFGVGAMIGPQVAAFALNRGNYAYAYMIGGLLMLALVLPFGQVRIVREEHTAEMGGAVDYQWAMLIPFIILLFASTGTEVGFGSWMFVQMQKVALASKETAALAVSVFWAGQTAGRAIASLLLRRISDRQLVQYTIVLIISGVALLLLFGNSAPFSVACAFIIGLGCAPVFPTTLGMVRGLYPTTYGTVSGVLIGLSNLGSIALPWLQGQVGAGKSGGMQVTLVLSVLMFFAVMLVQRQARLRVASGA